MREEHNATIHTGSTSSILLDACLGIPSRPEDVLPLLTIDNHCASTLRWTFLYVIDIASDGVNDNICEGYALIFVSVRA